MRLEFFFALVAAGSLLLVGCSSASEGAAGTSGAGGGSADGGAGGSGGMLDAGGAVASASASSSGSGGVGCGGVSECGTFGNGCVKCAITSVCAAPYKTCADDQACITYSGCFNGCSPSDAGCINACAQKSPQGASEYGAIIKCVICGACSGVCAATPGQCS